MKKVFVGIIFSGLMLSYSASGIIRGGCLEKLNIFPIENKPAYDYNVESGATMHFDYSHRGVTGCKREDAIEHAESICKRKFNVPPSSHVAILLMEFEDDYWTTGWPGGARKCKYYAKAACEFIDY